MEGRGSGRQFAGASRSNCMKTRFQISTNRPPRIVGKLLVLAARLGGFRTQIVVDFRARPAGAGVAHLPEIVLLVEAEDAALGHAGHLLPELLGVVVLAEDGDVELVFGQAVVLGDQVPGELDGFGLEIIAEGEIAQHLEEGVMAAGVADVFQVVMLAAGAHAFLRAWWRANSRAFPGPGRRP